jgi:superfamily II DNA or RNA helicase
MAGDQYATLSYFKTFGGILVSIKCLDEGIDIPTITHAFILASSQNPRQFIQRRGRVLRKAANKYIAVIHDAIVIPNSLEDEPEQLAILKSELLRAMEFSKSAINRDSGANLRAMALDLGLDPDLTVEDGIEDESEEEV